MGEAPILQRVGGRAPARLDVGENLDRRGYARARDHSGATVARA